MHGNLPTAANIAALRLDLANAKEPEQAIAIGATARSFEELIENAGFGKEREKIRPFRELWIESRWMLGAMLAKMVRSQAGPGRGKKGERSVPAFSKELDRLGIKKPRAIEAQRLATYPRDELLKFFKACGELPELAAVLIAARPYWAQANRKAKHQATRDRAIEAEEELGPFPLIYADPPWKWGHFGQRDLESEMGKGRTPDQHYETLTHEKIEAFEVQGKLVRQIAHDNAALFLWCTSSNLARALEVMKAWDFEFKSSATWVKFKDGKLRTGTGLVFRNAHEILLYGTRGKMPGPQWQPPSVFLYPRGKHSAKPPEIRKVIERMYPDFDTKTRLELFARDRAKGWTPYGLEAPEAAE